MRLIGGAGAILLFLSLLGPVILRQLSPVVLLLALGPALLWMTTWIWEGRPPKGWSAKQPDRVDDGYERIRKGMRRHIVIGLVLGIGALIFALLEISTQH